MTEFDRELLQALPGLRHFALRVTKNLQESEDLVQDTCVRALQYAHYYTLGTNIFGWLCLMLMRVYKNQRRRSGRMIPVDPTSFEDKFATPFDTLSNRIDLAKILNSFDDLSEEHRTLLLLSGIQGMTSDEMAEEIGMALGTVKSRLCRARAILRKRFGETPWDRS